MSKNWNRRGDSNSKSVASETTALSGLSYAGVGTPTATRTLIARLGNECPFPLDDGRKWGDRRESNSRRLVHSQPPEPLGYGHIWWIERASNSHHWFAGPGLSHWATDPNLTYTNMERARRIELRSSGWRPEA